jgi:hypothetical protein
MGKRKNSFYLYNSKTKKRKEIKANHYRAIKIKYLGPTDTKGSRIILTDTRNKKRITISYDHSQRGTFEIAIKYLLEIGIKTDSYYYDNLKPEYVILTSNFEIMINKQKRKKNESTRN